MNIDITKLNWDKVQGLMPAIMQHAESGEVLMLGYMNEAALQQTMSSRKATFFSRTRQALWVKGETSGNFLQVNNISVDCDQDSLLMSVMPAGPVCHQGTQTCFNDEALYPWRMLTQLQIVIAKRAQQSADQHYTASLLNSGLNRVAQKVGEEAVEVVVAALAESDKNFCGEMADLFYHSLVLLQLRELSINDVLLVLQKRALKSVVNTV